MKKSIILLFLISLNLFAKFEVTTLGASGGVVPGTTTSYLIRDLNRKEFLSLDAGATINGLDEAIKKGNFKDIQLPSDSKYTKLGYMFRDLIKGYFISHSHLDHVAGLAISSTEDTKKNIYALPSVVKIMEDSLFNWKLWPNFGNTGQGFKLGVYTYKNLEVGKEFDIENTGLKGKVFPLSHSNYESSMLLVKNESNEYFAFFGDTGADRVENTNMLDTIWKELAPLLKNKKLKGIIIEVSYLNDTKDKDLYGHLTANLLMEELEKLAKYSGNINNLKGLNVIVNHIKPSLLKDVDNTKLIRKEIETNNKYGINFIFPIQGESYIF